MLSKIRMCSTCAGAFKFNPDDHDETPDTHADVGEECPTTYRE